MQLCLLSSQAQQELLFLHKTQRHSCTCLCWGQTSCLTQLTFSCVTWRCNCAILRFARVEMHADLAGVKFILHRINLNYYTEGRQYIHPFAGSLLYMGNVLSAQMRRGRASTHLHHHGVHHIIKSSREGNKHTILKEAASSVQQGSGNKSNC